MKSYVTIRDGWILLLRQLHGNLRQTNQHYLAVRMLPRLSSLQTNYGQEWINQCKNIPSFHFNPKYPNFLLCWAQNILTKLKEVKITPISKRIPVQRHHLQPSNSNDVFTCLHMPYLAQKNDEKTTRNNVRIKRLPLRIFNCYTNEKVVIFYVARQNWTFQDLSSEEMFTPGRFWFWMAVIIVMNWKNGELTYG